MAKKSNKGQINFFRFMAVLGFVIVIWVLREFLSAAPTLPISKIHKGPPPAKACLECHVKEAEKAPIMPHRPWDNCTFCHKPAGSK